MEKIFKIDAIKFSLTCGLILFGLIAKSQNRNDTLQIKDAALNYVEGFYNADTLRMKKAIHPELVKRIVMKGENGFSMIKNMGATELIYATSKYKKTESDKPFIATVNIYDISSGIASIKVVTNKFTFIDYLQMAKINNEWKILNVLWAFNI